MKIILLTAIVLIIFVIASIIKFFIETKKISEHFRRH